ncbi:hypothetical protein H310_03838 [Aphanomyces invadans]|uniref:DNA alkylation repair enzyme n=1 Tax=Aphanomyces invadans TaxID=157072 RepID=A0A024UEH3_9STRA|nr:hypothetical protein H310_03838 [Aphanomyces invadans]ETW04674.1 hypothetical protein H310_03838 [Aphanomyces invadans]|eukprot:XP_008866113.1 hypothetical protein H310_03838 [Aphanomyces invadans]
MPVLRSKASKKIVASASSLLQCLEGLAKPSYAQQAVKFVHRSYCPNDIFVGIRVPQCREAVKTHLGSTTLKDILDLIHDARHEMRLTGFIALTEAFHRPHSASWWSDDGVPTEDHIKHLGYSPDDLRRHAISRIYLDNTRFCNNWDLVDASAHKILGEQLVHFHATELAAYCASPTKCIDELPAWYQRLLQSKDLWETRISIVLLLRLLPTEHCNVAYAICLHHINKFDADPSLRCTLEGASFPSLDLIHKALGWVLREAGKRNKAALTRFLDEHAAKAFKTTVRYATEHMDRAKAKRYVDRAQKGVASHAATDLDDEA